jgi:hypothetical protein
MCKAGTGITDAGIADCELTEAGMRAGAGIGYSVCETGATGGAGFTIGTAPGGVHPVATRVAAGLDEA